MEEQRFKKQQEIIKARAARLEVINNILMLKIILLERKKRC